MGQWGQELTATKICCSCCWWLLVVLFFKFLSDFDRCKQPNPQDEFLVQNVFGTNGLKGQGEADFVVIPPQIH